MPQIRICPSCKKVLQTNEIHKCTSVDSGYTICEKCGNKYSKSRPHICPTVIK